VPVTGFPVLLLTGLALLWACGVAFAMWMLTHPPRRTYSNAVARGRPGDPSELPGSPRPFEQWTLRTRGLELPVWDIRGDDPAGPVLIMTHGWADSKIGGLVRLGAVAPLASRVLIWDLPGHGEAPGICRLGTREVSDLLALVEYLQPASLVLMGWSLGAGVSLAAANSLSGPVSVKGIIAEAPYRLPGTPASNVLRARGLPASIIVGPALAILRLVCGRDISRNRFDRATAAKKSRHRLLVIHGSADPVCPVQDGRDIAAAANGELVEIQGAGHNDLWTEPGFADQCQRAVERFLGAPAGQA
jgi:pimeloyl-ACP methyl ester carboxylesterase